MELFEFRDAQFERVVCIGLRTAVTAVLPEKELEELFGGWIIYSDEFNADYIGVWRARKGQALRRILRERGTDISLVRARPNDLRVRVWRTQPNWQRRTVGHVG